MGTLVWWNDHPKDVTGPTYTRVCCAGPSSPSLPPPPPAAPSPPPLAPWVCEYYRDSAGQGGFKGGDHTCGTIDAPGSFLNKYLDGSGSSNGQATVYGAQLVKACIDLAMADPACDHSRSMIWTIANFNFFTCLCATPDYVWPGDEQGNYNNAWTCTTVNPPMLPPPAPPPAPPAPPPLVCTLLGLGERCPAPTSYANCKLFASQPASLTSAFVVRSSWRIQRSAPSSRCCQAVRNHAVPSNCSLLITS